MQHLTIVYTINDEKAFEPELSRIRSLISKSFGKNYAITAWSHDHEMNRVNMIEEAIEKRCDQYVIEEIANGTDMGQYRSLTEFLSRNDDKRYQKENLKHWSELPEDVEQ